MKIEQAIDYHKADKPQSHVSDASGVVLPGDQLGERVQRAQQNAVEVSSANVPGEALDVVEEERPSHVVIDHY